ncbi:unnamed protein product, partial [Durusdinium trenchii]
HCCGSAFRSPLNMLSTRRLMWALYLVISVAAVRLDTGKQVDVNGDSLLIKAVHESERKLPSLPAEWRDRFEIEKELAEGGDGVVYKLHVLCGSGDSFVSAKLVTAKKGVAKAAERMRLMKDEEYVISSIGVPDSVDTTDGRWIMMPFMNSGSFSALFRACRDSDACMCQTKEHPSPCWETIREHDLLWVLALFYQAVEGVSAIHAKGYAAWILLDNIMLQCKGTSCFASIIDLDQMCGPGEGDCEGGTVGFAAPEVHEGHQGLPANDVWSMGTVLYILLYGEWPPYMEFFWNPDSARKQAAYKPEEDATIPKKRRSIDNLVVEMLNTCLGIKTGPGGPSMVAGQHYFGHFDEMFFL